MTRKIRKELNTRYRLFQKAKVTPRGSNEWRDYKKLRNRRSNLIKNAKAKYWQNEFKNSKNSKSFWKTVRKFRGDSTDTKMGPLKTNENIVTNDIEKAEVMNKFYASVGKELSMALKDPTENETNSNKHIYRVTPTSSEIKPNFELFQKSFKSTVKLGKACGPDKISARDLKLNESASIHGLYQVLCQITKTLTFPTAWKMAQISCIFKKGSKRDYSNSRGSAKASPFNRVSAGAARNNSVIAGSRSTSVTASTRFSRSTSRKAKPSPPPRISTFVGLAARPKAGQTRLS